MTIAWKESRHSHNAYLGGPGVLPLSVWWDWAQPRGYDGPRWKASVFGQNFKQNFSTLEEGKAATEAEARRIIGLATRKLCPQELA